jgi:prefoldin alpha subunit
MNLNELPVHQLKAVGTQLDDEIQAFTANFGHLRRAQLKYQSSLQCTQKAKNQESLIPLTNSLYVPGVLLDKIMVDVGTGYFIEKDRKSAGDFYTRKIDFLQKSLLDLEGAINMKQGQKRVLVDVLDAKLKSLSVKAN